MNRNFKFRVWSTKENKWMFGYEYPNLGGFSLVGETVLLGEYGRYELDRYFNDFVIMQWTGLKDKNSKDIYEGDILKRMDTGDMYLVIWDNGCYLSRTIYDSWINKNVLNLNKDRLLSSMMIFKVEIIGNIYENPGLIK